jgi:hypothetical protein
MIENISMIVLLIGLGVVITIAMLVCVIYVSLKDK